jgi:uncharacterized protein (DUF2164 family)
MIASIQRFVEENTEEKIGDLKARLFLDFFLQELGPSVYNQAIADAQAQLLGRINELDGECYEPEFGYWKR